MQVVHELEDTVEDELPPIAGEVLYRSHWQLFLPTLLIFVIYGIGLIWLWLSSRSDGSLFRLFALIMGIGVPLMAAHAFLRYETVRVRFGQDGLRYHAGWPQDAAMEIPYELITKLIIRRGISGRLFGGGTVVIETLTGMKKSIADLKDPEGLVDEFSRRIASTQMPVAPDRTSSDTDLGDGMSDVSTASTI